MANDDETMKREPDGAGEPARGGRAGLRVELDLGAGTCSIETGRAAETRIHVDGIDRTGWFQPYLGGPLSFCTCPVLAFGGDGAHGGAETGVWEIDADQVVVVTADGTASLAARGGATYDSGHHRLTGSDAVLRFDLPGRREVHAGRRISLDVASHDVEVEP